ncbi:MAG: Dabb family protein [Ginsengibacter sp.]
MKKIVVSFSMIVAAVLFANCALAQTKSSQNIFRHVVIMSFKPGTSADSIKTLDDLYLSLSKDPSVLAFEWGVNVSSRDTTELKHVYVTTFASKDDMKIYSKNLLYPKLFKVSLLIAEDVNVVDYWVNK